MKTYLKEWLENRAVTPEQLAAATKVSPKMIDKYISGTTTPSLEVMSKFAMFMGLSVDLLTLVDPATMEEATLVKESEDACNTFIAQWMNEYNINPVQLSEMTGIDNFKISAWLNGSLNPTVIEICKVADALNILVDDLINRHPLSAVDEYVNQHIIETNDIETAVRVQNYFKEMEIDCSVVVIVTKSKERFVIRYTFREPFEPKDICKIAKKRKYGDSREKSINKMDRYLNMEICNI